MSNQATKKHYIGVLLTSVSLLLSGCQPPGENLQSNVYKAGQVNSVQEAKQPVEKLNC